MHVCVCVCVLVLREFGRAFQAVHNNVTVQTQRDRETDRYKWLTYQAESMHVPVCNDIALCTHKQQQFLPTTAVSALKHTSVNCYYGLNFCLLMHTFHANKVYRRNIASYCWQRLNWIVILGCTGPNGLQTELGQKVNMPCQIIRALAHKYIVFFTFYAC